jgi:thymidylate kinase
MNWVASRHEMVTIQCLEALESAGIQTCLFHNRALFEEKSLSDLDVVVGTRDLRAVARVLDATLRQTGGRLIQGIRHESTACYFVGTYCDGAAVRFLKFDVASDYRAVGGVFFSGSEFIESRVRSGDFWLSPVGLRFAYYLVKRLIKADIGPDQRQYLSGLYSQDAVQCDNQMLRLLALRDVTLIKGALSGRGWTDVLEDLPGIRRRLMWQSFLNHPIGCAAYFPRDVVRRSWRVLFPTGLWVAFLGPDGSGKSTVLRLTKERLEPAFRLTCDYHLRPGIVGPKGRAGAETAPHSRPPRGIAGSIAKVGMMWIDYALGYIARVRPRLVRSTLVLFDRCFHDLAVDPLRYRYGGPRWLAAVAAKMAPKPDIFLVLDAPTESLQARKQEVASLECERQRGEYRELAARLGERAVVIDASRTLPAALDDALTAVLTRLHARTARRWGLPV